MTGYHISIGYNSGYSSSAKLNEDEERAKEGHEKWVNAIKENPDIKLPHLMLWE